MVEALRTSASPAAIWAIVVVAVVALAFWLTAIVVADAQQARDSRRRRMLGAAREPVGAQGLHAPPWEVPQGDIPTRVDLPAQPRADHRPAQSGTAGAPASEAGGLTRADMPAQRAADADRAQPTS